jgi:hypothetical protein
LVSVREKLDHATVAGAVLVAVFVGAMSGSWTAFWVVAGRRPLFGPNPAQSNPQIGDSASDGIGDSILPADLSLPQCHFFDTAAGGAVASKRGDRGRVPAQRANYQQATPSGSLDPKTVGSRRDSGNLISLMSIRERKSLEKSAFLSKSQRAEKRTFSDSSSFPS